ncbi:unnamed protein product [Closterium sp. NIES-54]
MTHGTSRTPVATTNHRPSHITHSHPDMCHGSRHHLLHLIIFLLPFLLLHPLPLPHCLSAHHHPLPLPPIKHHRRPQLLPRQLLLRHLPVPWGGGMGEYGGWGERGNGGE